MKVNRLFKSSNFYNAVFGTLFALISYQLNESEFMAGGIFALFGGRTIVTGGKDLIRAQKGQVYNKEKGTYETVN